MLPAFEQAIDRLFSVLDLPLDTPRSTPPKPDLGDIAIPCFELGKEQGKNPALVAQELAQKAQAFVGGLIASVSAAGPFLNITWDPAETVKAVLDTVAREGDRYGSLSANGKSVLIEYPSQNTHKEFHIGHLRNVCIGNTLVALYEKAGFSVTAVNYLNDFGAHVVKCLWALQKFHADETPPENKQRWLGQIYAEASSYLKEHPEVQTEIDQLQLKLEARDASLWPLFEKTRAWSTEGFERLHHELGLNHQATFFESDVKDRGKEVVGELLSKGVAQEGERGAVIVDLEAYHLDTALIRKASGAGLYMTSDLALAEEKNRRFPAAESLYITGFEQNFYFKQLAQVLKLSGFTGEIIHIGYGLVMLPEGKMSSRAGSVILYEDLRNVVEEKLQQEIIARHTDWSAEKVHETARVLALAALKYTIQKHEAAKTIIFSIDEATSFEGMNAPYILYAVARMNSLLRKAAVSSAGTSFDPLLLSHPSEKHLSLCVADYTAMLAKALDQRNPSVVAKYVFDLAQAFNDWYAKCPILTDDPALTRARCFLVKTVRQVLVDALEVLTIEAVEEM